MSDALLLLSGRLQARPRTEVHFGIRSHGAFYCYLGNEDGMSDANEEGATLEEAISNSIQAAMRSTS